MNNKGRDVDPGGGQIAMVTAKVFEEGVVEF